MSQIDIFCKGFAERRLKYNVSTSQFKLSKSTQDLEPLVGVILTYGRTLKKERGEEYQKFASVILKTDTANNSYSQNSPYVITVRKIKGAIQCDPGSDVSSDEEYVQKLKELTGLPVCVGKLDQEELELQTAKEGAVAYFIKHSGTYCPMVAFLNSFLVLHRSFLNFFSKNALRVLKLRVDHYKNVLKTINEIKAKHPDLSIVLYKSSSKSSDDTIQVYPFLHFELQSDLTKLPEEFRNQLKEILNSVKYETCLGFIKDLLNVKQTQVKFTDTISLEKKDDSQPGDYVLHYDQTGLFVSRENFKHRLIKPFPELVDEVKEVIKKINAQALSQLRKRFPENYFNNKAGKGHNLSPRQKFVVMYNPFKGSPYQVLYKDFDLRKCSTNFTQLPSQEQITKLLKQTTLREYVVKYKSQQNSIPFELDHYTQNNPAQIYVGYGYYFEGIDIRVRTVRGDRFKFNDNNDIFQLIQATMDNFPAKMQLAQEMLLDARYSPTDKLLVTNSVNFSSEVPEAISGVEKESLIELFQQIDFSDSQNPGYIDPTALTMDGKPATLHQLVKSLIFFVSRLNLNRHIKKTSVPTDPAEQVKFKREITAYLTHIISALKAEQDLFIRNDMLYQIAESGDLCGRRWQNIVFTLYNRYVLKNVETSDNVEQLFLEASDQLKSFAITQMVSSKHKQNAHEAPTFMKALFLNRIHVPGAKAFENQDVNDELGFDGRYRSEEAVIDGFFRFYTTHSLFKKIAESIDSKIHKTKGQFLANLLNVVAAQIIDEMKDEPAFKDIDAAYEVKKNQILKELSQEEIENILSKGNTQLDNATNGKKSRVEVTAGSSITNMYQEKLEQLVIELREAVAEIDSNAKGKTKSRLQLLKVQAETAEAKETKIREAKENYKTFVLGLKDELICEAAENRQRQKEHLAFPIAKQRKYFHYDESDLPTNITKEGIISLLFYFKLIEKNSNIMQD